MTLAISSAAALTVFAAALAVQSRRRLRWLARRVGVQAAAPVREPQVGERRLLESHLGRLFSATEARLSGSPGWRGLDHLVERAALPLRTVELVYAGGVGAILLAILAAALGGGAPGAVLGPLAALLALQALLRIRATRRLHAFEAQLPDLLDSIGGALRAGHSFLQGVQAVANEAEEPAASELKRVLAEARLGRPLDQALGDLGRRLGSKELELVLDAVVIQRQVGGSLAGIFAIVADATRQRQQFAQKLRALTATGRSSASVLVALPICVAGLLTLLNPGYMRPLYSTSTGHLLLGGAAALMALGAAWLRRIVAVGG